MKTENELIAEFMGLTLKKEIDGIKYYNVPVGHIESYNASQGDFKYHKRWDWLMPVVVEIERVIKDYPNKDTSWLYFHVFVPIK